MDVVLDKLVTSSQEFSGKDNNGGGTISDFSILDLGKLAKNLGGWMSDLQLLEDGGTIVGDEDSALGVLDLN